MSFIRIINRFPFAGVSEGEENVAPAASAVTVKKLRRLPPVGAGVADDAVVVFSLMTFVEAIKVLFVSVSVPASVAKSLSESAVLNCAVVEEIHTIVEGVVEISPLPSSVAPFTVFIFVPDTKRA